MIYRAKISYIIYRSTSSSYWGNFSSIASMSISFASHWSLCSCTKSNPWAKYARFSRLVQSGASLTAQKFEFFLPFYDTHKLFVDRETRWLHAAAGRVVPYHGVAVPDLYFKINLPYFQVCKVCSRREHIIIATDNNTRLYSIIPKHLR